MMRLNIPLTDNRELEEIAKVLSTGYFTQGPKTLEFEKKIADYIGSKHAFAMSSCTTALHLALVVLGVKHGDEVLVADFTFPATANVVVQLGATPIFVDIDLDTFTMNVDDLCQKITPRTKAIIPVDAFGCAADYDPILKVAAEYGIPVLEDAATAIGTKYYDRFCGNITTLGCFSFHPRKVITTGEGGMITTNDDHLAEQIKLLRSHGGVKVGAWFQYEEAGFNYRLSDVLSAMGVAQIEKLSWIVERKRDLARALSHKLSEIPSIRTPFEPKWGGHIYQSYVILVEKGLDRDKIVDKMRNQGVETTIGTYALHDQPLFQRQFGYKSGQLPNSHIAFMRTITLPLYPQMDESDLDTIAKATNL
ncbi:MAG: DegT/DnrJ/EryC1/StrS family aminotransferase [Anaerolineales bacterium]|nr:DegT/DnrJ/EryC1/StrS family aminotransferase [Anaerolineales bacterium]